MVLEYYSIQMQIKLGDFTTAFQKIPSRREIFVSRSSLLLVLIKNTNLSSPKNNGLIAIYLCLAITVSSCLWSTVHCFVTKAETLQISMLHSALHSAAAKFPRHCALGFSILSVYFRGSLVSESIDMWCNTIRWSVKLMMSYTVQEKNLYFNTRPILQLAEAELAAIVQYLQLFI